LIKNLKNLKVETKLEKKIEKENVDSKKKMIKTQREKAREE